MGVYLHIQGYAPEPARSALDVPEREGDAEAAREVLEAGKSEDARLLLATHRNDEGEGGVRTLPKDFLTKTFFLRAKTV